ncbi:MAG: uracil-DNA glycosylase family protein [Rikenellaceae bacterium]|nr:uracil-DNA glycosylase family protein [Rikenellaceae bacterium]MBR3801284.1 uracil-DNA glycosylase family protein [Rikenellaceae bacterium]
MFNTKYSTERHPLQPFLPEGARVLMLGSFPPKHERWSMEFFYPNWINDMWRVMGVVFFGDRRHFEVKDAKRFDRERIIDFCTTQGIALFDTASEVRRLKDNASDKFLEVITPTDIEALLAELPHCQAIVTTGQKATETIAERFGCTIPAVGSSTQLIIGTRKLRFWRMPSTSRAYPLALDKKAEVYRTMFEREGYTTK